MARQRLPRRSGCRKGAAHTSGFAEAASTGAERRTKYRYRRSFSAGSAAQRACLASCLRLIFFAQSESGQETNCARNMTIIAAAAWSQSQGRHVWLVADA